MSDGMFLTRAGHVLLAKALTGKPLVFTRGCAGDGELTGDETILELTDLISPKRDLDITSYDVIEDTGVAEVTLDVNNKGLEEAFWIREYGVFARDPDTGEELLYAYRNVGDEASYLPKAGKVDTVNYVLTLATVIDQAENVTAIVVNNNSYITLSKLENRVNGLFAEPDEIDYFWTHKEGDIQKLRPATVEIVRALLLGNHDFRNLNSRLEVVENAIAKVLLKFEDMDQYPDYMNFIVENFNNTNQIDLTSTNITSIIRQDDSIDVDDIEGLLPGSWYTLTDGVNSELVQIKTINRENGIYRVILKEPVKQSYLVSTARMYRTSAVINTGYAGGTVQTKQSVWNADHTWYGLTSEAGIVVDGSLSTYDASQFIMDETIKATSDGYFRLG